MLTFQHCLRVEDPRLREALWQLAELIFAPLCEQTPINQFYPRDTFEEFLLNEEVIKILEFSDGTLCGFGLATENVDLEPILTSRYFAKHFPGKQTFLVMLVGVHPDYRRGEAGPEIYRQIGSYMHTDGIGLYLHSDDINPHIPRLMDIIYRKAMITERVDSEVCWLYHYEDKPRLLPERRREDLLQNGPLTLAFEGQRTPATP
ncbi:MAG TPA: hypothetical protein VGM23_13215 [Armatimonadota bacterium]